MIRLVCSLLIVSTLLTGRGFAQNFNLNDVKSYIKDKNFTQKYKVEIIDNLMFLQIRLNQSSQSFRFLVDTGAPMAISQQVANVIQPKWGKRVMVNSSGAHKDSLRLVLLDSVQIGNLKFYDLVSIVADFTQGEVMKCYHVDGIIGSNLMSLAIWQFNQSSSEIIISDQFRKLPNVKKTAKIPIELWGWQKSPLFNLLINRNLVHEKVLFDTGFGDFFSWSRKTFNLVRNRNLIQDSCIIQGQGTAVETIFGKDADSITYKVILKELDFGSVQFQNSIVDVDLDDGSKIGAEILTDYVVTLDYIRRKMHFKSFGKKQHRQAFKSFGFQPYLRENDVYVAYLYENSPAHKAGMKLHNRVLAINGISLREINLMNKCDLFRKIRQTLRESDEIEVEFADSGETRKVKLQQTILLGN
jgi:predicted aspartyl protease